MPMLDLTREATGGLGLVATVHLLRRYFPDLFGLAPDT